MNRKIGHSFASVAADLGYTEPTIAAMLGHAVGSITSRNIHHLNSLLISSADNVVAWRCDLTPLDLLAA